MSPAREPLGVMDACMWARQPKAADGKRHDIKEGQRWIEGHKRVTERARELPETQQVYVADREADIMDFLVRARDLDHAADYLIRCQHDRPLSDGPKFWAQLKQNVGAGAERNTWSSSASAPARWSCVMARRTRCLRPVCRLRKSMQRKGASQWAVGCSTIARPRAGRCA